MIKIKDIIKNDNLKIQMMLSVLCKPMSMIISYLYIPVVLNYLGDEKYGVWSTILSILSWVTLFDIGIGNGLRNKLTESLNNHDNKSRKFVSSSYAFISIIMITLAVVASAISGFIDWNRVFGVNEINESLAGIVIISLCFVCFNFILSICKNVLYALQKAAFVGMLDLAVQVVNLIGVLVIIQFWKGNLFAMAMIYGLSITLVNVIASFILYKRNPRVRPSVRMVSIKEGKEVTSLGLQFFVMQACALVLFTTDSVIISMLYGASNVTPYNIVNKLFQVIIGIYVALIMPIWSGVSKLKAEKNYDAITNIVKKMNLVMIPFILLSILFAILINPITKIWLGRTIDFSLPLVIFGCLYCILTIWCNTYSSISNGLQIMKPSMFFAVIQAVVNIPLSLLLAEGFGMKTAGILGGTVLSMMIAAIVAPVIIKIYIKKFREETDV